jgi:uncharacterized protein YwqG
MVKKASITFIEVSKPIREPVTKFGGQPVWIETPQWPLSKSTGKPMMFICQLELFKELFPETMGEMAYLFMTDDEEGLVDGTWEPDGGENAIIIQPGGMVTYPISPINTGPTLKKYVKAPGKKKLQPKACEFKVKLTFSEDMEFVSEEELCTWEEEKRTEYSMKLEGNKIAGTPGFLQGDEFPHEETRKLLIQLDSTHIPFDIDFGDAGIGYGFVNEEGTIAKFLWQCC